MDTTQPPLVTPLGTRRDVSVSMARVNLVALPLSILPIPLVGIPYVLLWGMANLIGGLRVFVRPWVVIPAFLVGVILHELLHGVGWMLFGRKPWGAIKFGFNVASLNPYAHCREPLLAHAYRLGTAAPAIILGLIPVVWGFIAGQAAFVAFGTLFLVAAGGDFLVLWIIRSVPGDRLVEDHPARAGCYVYDPPGSESASE